VEAASVGPARRLGIKLCIVLVVAVVLPAGTTLLYAVPPGESGLYPRCVFHLLTGLHCPGCGLTRCLHALLHGQWLQALAYNGLAVVALPLVALWSWRLLCSLWTGKPMAGRPLSAWSLRLIFWTLVAYWVLRNLEMAPFHLLAPHAI
jgi:hypothetical protein